MSSRERWRGVVGASLSVAACLTLSLWPVEALAHGGISAIGGLWRLILYLAGAGAAFLLWAVPGLLLLILGTGRSGQAHRLGLALWIAYASALIIALLVLLGFAVEGSGFGDWAVLLTTAVLGLTASTAFVAFRVVRKP